MGKMRLRLLQLARYTVIVAVLFCAPFTGVETAVAATRNEVGISTSTTLLSMNQSDLNQRLDDIVRLNATWIRVDFSWPDIQPGGPHDYKWGPFDRVVDAAAAHHLKILADLDYTPAWAQEPQCAALVPASQRNTCNPRSTKEFAHFAAKASFRYRNKCVRAWEIWNEPNLPNYWKTVEGHKIVVDPIKYARFANAAAAQIRYHDPTAVVLTGGLSPMFEPKPSSGMRQSDYLAQLLPHLNRAFFDGIGFHPYTWPILPSKPVVYNAFYTVDNGKPEYNLRDIMTKAGWGDKQIWGTEFGATTKGNIIVTRPTPTKRSDHVTEETQAQIVSQGITDWYDKPNVGPLFVHSDSDQWLIVKTNNQGGFGLRRDDGSEKPAYTAFLKAAERIKQMR